MTAAEPQAAKRLREVFIDRFVDTNGERYREYLAQNSDRCACFLWDCLKAETWGKPCTQERAAEFLARFESVYFMWDFWRSGTELADKYPGAVMRAPGAELGRFAADEWNAEIEAEKHDCYIEYPRFPSDIYVFDESFSWFVIFTHESDEYERLSPDDIERLCIIYN